MTVFFHSLTVFRLDRGTRGGGVAVLIKHNAEAVVLQQTENHESLLLKINYAGHSFTLGALYMPPDSNPEYLLRLQDHVFV